MQECPPDLPLGPGSPPSHLVAQEPSLPQPGIVSAVRPVSRLLYVAVYVRVYDFSPSQPLFPPKPAEK